MVRQFSLPLLFGMMLLLNGGITLADSNCGEARHCQSCCKSCRHHHSCCCCCNNDSRSRSFPGELGPRAAVVESMPVFQMTPGVMAMPMMMASFGAANTRGLEQPRSTDRNCSASKDRMDDLEAQVDALNLRMKTIQRSMEIQVRLLEEMKAEGTFPKRYPQQQPPAGN